MTYGRRVLTHPLVVEAAQTLFVPACVYNNTKDDADARVREAFGEPAWNNPVVRIVDAAREDLVPRVADDGSLAGLVRAMVAALAKAGRDVPAWLRLLDEQEAARRRGTRSAAFAMTWFWVGDAQLGALAGVVSTRSGWLEGREVVEVEFDPSRLPLRKLVQLADARDCALRVYARTDEERDAARALVGGRALRSDAAVRVDDDKYHVSRSALRHLPMTALQAARVNARLAAGGAVADLLSPGQRALLARIEAAPQRAWPVAIGVDFVEAWKKTR